MNTRGFWKFAICICFHATWVQAFTLNGTDSDMHGWNTRHLQFQINTANCPGDIENHIEDAVNVWNSVSTSRLRLGLGGSSTDTAATLQAGTATDTPTVVCDSNFISDSGVAANSGVLGAGFINKPGTGGSIGYGYLLLNVQPGDSGNINNFDGTIISITIAHEIGHVLGLGHSSDANALMYYDVSAKTNLALSQDDIDGITYLYPRNELGPDPLLGGCGLITSGTSNMYGSSILLALLIAILSLPMAMAFSLRQLHR